MSKKQCILSITTSGHGVGACLCVEGKVVAANTLERLTRKKYDIMLPLSKIDLAELGWNAAPKQYTDNIDLPFDLEHDYSEIDFGELGSFNLFIGYLLETAGLSLKDIDCVTYSYRYNEQARKFFRKLNPKIEFIVPEHHYAHACQAFLASPFEEAAIMVVDGQGVPLERTAFDPLSGCLAYGKGNKIEVLRELPVEYSLGGMYAAVTRLCGFKTNEEGKTMGLAPYGRPDYYERVKHNIKFEQKAYSIHDWRGIIKRGLKPKHFPYTFNNFNSFLRQFSPKTKSEEYSDTYKNLAYLGQKMIEDVMTSMAHWLHENTHSENLCIAGGVGLNCVANYKVFANSRFKKIFVYPNCGDNGLCVGQALYAYNILDGNPRRYVAVHDYMGRSYSKERVKRALEKFQGRPDLVIREYKDVGTLCKDMASFIAEGKITSWFQGGSEFGPRALGNRSIIADPRRKEMKEILNSRVKFRESFRPFTPSVLEEKASEFFTLDVDSPFMLLAPYVKPGKAEIVPAITHVDNTARVQTVNKDINPRYYALIKAFEAITNVPMVLNTSFNVAGQPIVETPEDAVDCFFSTDIDILGIDQFIVEKKRSSK